MHIALVNKYWYLKGGSERVVFNTKEVLEQHGHEVSCFGMQHPDNQVSNDFLVPHIEYQDMHGIKKVSAGIASVYSRTVRKAFGLFLDQYRPEVIHAHNIYHQLSFSIIDAARERSIPVVMTLHDYHLMSPNYTMFHHGANDLSMVGGKYYRCLITNCEENWGKSVIATIEAYVRTWRRYAEKIDRFIAPSEWMREMCMRAGMDTHKVVTIPNPLSTVVSKKPSNAGDYVLYFGRFSEEKGLMVLLDAAEKTPEIPYRLVGQGPLGKKLENYCNEKKISNVSIHPFQAEDELVNTIAGARLTVLPSIWHENAPMSVLKSIIQGRVVIASRVGGIPEMLPDALLVLPGNADALSEKIIEWFSTTEKKREEVVIGIQKKLIEKHDPEQYYRSLIACYEQIL